MDEEDDVKKPLLETALPSWWRVLPPLVLLIIICVIDSLSLNDFVEYRYTHYYEINSSSTANARELCLNSSRVSPSTKPPILSTTSIYPISSTTSKDDAIQAATARLNVYLSLAATAPAIFTSILLGANCDRIGRKPLIALPFVGKTLRYLILTAVAYYSLSDLWIIIAVTIDGLFGTAALCILSSFAYVSDCTTEKKRTLGITVTDVAISCSRFLPLITMGLYLERPRYVQAMIITFVLCIFGLVFSIFLQPESNLSVKHLSVFQQFKRIEFRAVTKCLRVFFVKREGHKQRSLLMLIGIHLSVITMLCGQIAMYYVYLYGAPFCFDSFGVSLNSMAQAATIILLTIILTAVLAKRSDHLVLPAIGTIAYMIHLVLFGIARQVWELYLAVCISAIFYVLIPVIRSRITKLVEPDEYAAVFILATVFESGGFYAISAVTNEIYQVSLTFSPGLVYFFLASFGAVVVLLTGYV